MSDKKMADKFKKAIGQANERAAGIITAEVERAMNEQIEAYERVAKEYTPGSTSAKYALRQVQREQAKNEQIIRRAHQSQRQRQHALEKVGYRASGAQYFEGAREAKQQAQQARGKADQFHGYYSRVQEARDKAAQGMADANSLAKRDAADKAWAKKDKERAARDKAEKDRQRPEHLRRWSVAPITKAMDSLDDRITKKLSSGGGGSKGVLGLYIFGKEGAKSISRGIADVSTQFTSEFGFKNLSKGLGTFFGNVRERGVMRAGGAGIGRGLIGILGSSYRETARQTTAMLQLSNITGRQAGGALRYNMGGLGYDPAETAQLSARYATATGDLGGKTSFRGKFGRFRNREGVINSVLAQRLGVGGAYEGLLGAMARTGTPMEGGTLVGQLGPGGKGGSAGVYQSRTQKVLKDIIGVAIDQGLKRGRWKEMFAGFAQVITRLPLGITANMRSVRNLSMLMGKAGFKGAQGTEAAGAMDSLVRGQGSGAAQGVGLLAAGIGERGFFGAYKRMQEGSFGSAGGMGRMRNYIKTLKQIYGDDRLVDYQISQMSGGKITMGGAGQIREAALDPNNTDASFSKRLRKVQEKNKPLQQKAFEGMSQFGKFRAESLAWRSKMYTLGKLVSGAILSISSSLRGMFSRGIAMFQRISQKGGWGRLWKGASKGVGGQAVAPFKILGALAGGLFGDTSMFDEYMGGKTKVNKHSLNSKRYKALGKMGESYLSSKDKLAAAQKKGRDNPSYYGASDYAAMGAAATAAYTRQMNAMSGNSAPQGKDPVTGQSQEVRVKGEVTLKDQRGRPVKTSNNKPTAPLKQAPSQ